MDYHKSDLKGEYQNKIKMSYKSSHLGVEDKKLKAKKPLTDLDDLEIKRMGTKVGAKKARGIAKETIHGITKPAIRRMARRGGVKRISGLMYTEARNVLKAFLKKTIHDTVAYCEHSRRTTVRASDCLNALHRNGRGLYGYNN